MPEPERKKKTHRYLQVVKSLSRELSRRAIPTHGLFHSEREVARRYKISPLTARKVYDILERRRLIYRIHGKGTFVAPASRRRRMLVVLDMNERLTSHDFDRVDFFLGALEASCTLSDEHEVIAIKEGEFRAIQGELFLRYPNLSGILFFRTIDLVLEVAPMLRERAVPFLFYGSGQHRERLGGIHARLYDEAEINALALEHLWGRGRRRIGVAYIEAGASAKRRLAWEAYLAGKGLAPDPSWAFEARKFYGQFHEVLRATDPSVFRSLDALYCTVDSFAVDAVQHLLALGLRVPEDVAVVTVNDSPVCLQIHPNLSTVAIPLFEDAKACFQKILDLSSAKDGALHERSPVALLERKSS